MSGIRRLQATALVVCAVMMSLIVSGEASGSVPVGSPADVCGAGKGWGGVGANVLGAATGSLRAPIVDDVNLDTPFLDGDVVRSNNSMTFKSWGNCSASVAFQLQTKVCGTWGCDWKTRNHGKYEFLWKHNDTGSVEGSVSMSCREGTHSYRVHMAVLSATSTQSQGADAAQGQKGPGAIGVKSTLEEKDGPVVKLAC